MKYFIQCDYNKKSPFVKTISKFIQIHATHQHIISNPNFSFSSVTGKRKPPASIEKLNKASNNDQQ